MLSTICTIVIWAASILILALFGVSVCYDMFGDGRVYRKKRWAKEDFDISSKHLARSGKILKIMSILVSTIFIAMVVGIIATLNKI